MALISAIVPTYNNERFMAETLSSLGHQNLAGTGHELEIVMIDDGSKDRTVEIAEAMRTQLPAQLKIVKQQNGRVCRARNHGFEVSQGDFIAWCDHDDVWHPDKLRLQMQVLHEHPEYGMVNSHFVRWEESANGNHPPQAELLPKQVDTTLDASLSGWTYTELLYDIYVLTSTSLMRRSLANATGPWNEKLPYAEDWEYWIRASRHTQFAQLLAPLVLYRMHRANGSRMVREKNWAEDVFANALGEWGLAAPDGKLADAKRVNLTRARNWYYHGHANLNGGSSEIARQSLWNAWRMVPTHKGFMIDFMRSLLSWR